jgi:putative DNA methylase
MDPPYYDNIGYADLSDFFYVIMRHALRNVYPDLFATMLVPKEEELVATPYRHGGKLGAERFFFDGMSKVLEQLHDILTPETPASIYYAFKQSEGSSEGASSTGWETFLGAVLQAALTVDGTWPIRTELPSRMTGKETNALASSIVLVCRRRPTDAPSATRGEFRRMLRKELPDALKKLQQGNIAPVDVAQASIGPGMAIFSRHKTVAEADGTPMTVRGALQLINEVLDEYLSSGEGDFDADTRFAITWYEQYGWDAGLFGDAENIAKARNVSVKGVEEAGICKSAAGKVRILRRSEMRPLDYDPATDERPTIWEFAQHMIRYLEDEGEEAAARLLKKLGAASDATRELAYRLYNTCERKKWAEDARSYNALILAWPELEKLASRMGDDAPMASRKKSGAKGTATKGTTKQRELFEGTDE